ncbi:MAG TPA: DUF3182 family protein [Pseudomonas sp.]|nr:DUF3182 family protein [Pseudomonas sp.]
MSTKAGVALLHVQQETAVHEQTVHRVLGQKIAALLGTAYLGSYDPQAHDDCYLIPDETLVGEASLRTLGIRDVGDFFGGAINQPFMATKAITHTLIEQPTHVPPGWSTRFSQQVSQAILRGYTVFDRDDAVRAGELLLQQGPVRLKPVRGKAGRGQEALSDRQQLLTSIAAQDADEVATWGLVIEENLSEVITYSVGQVFVAGITASYYGTQRLTHDNTGAEVYGGSDLVVVRGGYMTLSQLEMSPQARQAIEQACVYEQAAFECFGLLASRRNYDVAQGVDALGQSRSGVLEQSWRIGGASAAEIFALEAFSMDPALHCVRASTYESYGENSPPDDAVQLYSGSEPGLGILRKYAKIEPYSSS